MKYVKDVYAGNAETGNGKRRIFSFPFPGKETWFMKHVTCFHSRLLILIVLLLFLPMLFCPVHLFSEGSENFPVKTLWDTDFDRWFSHLPDDTRVRYPIAFPWKPEPEDVKYIFFMTAGQQAICNSTDSNMTGGIKGQQEKLYKIGSDTIRNLVATFINNDYYTWFTEGMKRHLKAQIAGLTGIMGGILLDQIINSTTGIPAGLGILAGTILEFGGIARTYIMNRIDYRISSDRNEELEFFKDSGSMGAQLFHLENMTMPDGSHFNKTNTLLVLNVRGLCVTDRAKDEGGGWEDIDKTREQTIKGYFDMLSFMSNGFENVRLIYFAGHSRGGVQALRMAKYFNESGLVPRKTRILVTSIDAVVDPGELGTSLKPYERIVINPRVDPAVANSYGILEIHLPFPLPPGFLNIEIDSPFHNHVYFAYYSDLKNFLDLDPSLPIHPPAGSGCNELNYDGNYFINNLVSGSMLNENYKGASEFMEGVIGLITKVHDKSAAVFDYDEGMARENRHGLLGMYSHNWVYKDHPTLCTKYDEAKVGNQLEYLHSVGFFPTYNIGVEVKVNRNTPYKPEISWDEANEELWSGHGLKSCHLKGYKIYRKIYPWSSSPPELTEPQSVRNWTHVTTIYTETVEQDGAVFIDNLQDPDLDDDDDLSEGDKVYYKVTCLIESRDKYAYESDSTYTTEPYPFSANPPKTYCYYSRQHPFAKKHAFIPRYKYTIPAEIDQAFYDQLPGNFKVHYTYDDMYDAYLLDKEITAHEIIQIREYLLDNRIDYTRFQNLHDVFGNTLQFDADTDYSYKNSVKPGLYYRNRDTNEFLIETLDRMIINNPVSVIPIDINNFLEDTSFELSLLTTGSFEPQRLEEVAPGMTLEEYGISQAGSGISGTKFVYNSNGEGLLFSTEFKEGYNSVWITFIDNVYDNEYEVAVLQHTIPPFILPWHPLKNQYINEHTFTAVIKPDQIDSYLLSVGRNAVGNEWFKNAVIRAFVDGRQVSVTLNDSENTAEIYLQDLAEGNHRIEVTAEIEGLKSYTSWQFWVDLTPPEVMFPSRMLLDDPSSTGSRSGYLITYIKDMLPYRDINNTWITDVSTVFLNTLTMNITDEFGDMITENFINKGICRLGSFGDHWHHDNHGVYFLEVTAVDRSGNSTTKKQEIYIDKYGPSLSWDINQVNISTETINSGNLPEITYTVELDEWEDDTLLKLEFRDDLSDELTMHTIGYVGNGGGVYTLNQFTDEKYGLKDGIYDITLIAEDEVGNETRGMTRSVRVDRTTPVIREASVEPSVIQPGSESFSVSFHASNLNDVESFKDDMLDAEISILDTDVAFIPGSIGNGYSDIYFDNSKKPFTFLPGQLDEGLYFLNITVTDGMGNKANDVIPVAYGFLPPEITSVSPSYYGTVDGDGLITLRGTVVDPHLYNGQDFLRYTLYYQSFSEGHEPAVPEDLTDLDGWLSDGMTVPEYQKKPGWPLNSGGSPVPSPHIIGMLDGTKVPDGFVKVLLIAEEEDGTQTAGARTFYVEHDSKDTNNVEIAFVDGIPSVKEFENEDDTLVAEYTIIHGYADQVDVIGYVKESSGRIVWTQSFDNIKDIDSSGTPVIDPSEKGFFLYREGEDRYTMILQNNNEGESEFDLTLSTESMFSGVTLDNSPAGELVSEDGKWILWFDPLAAGESHRIEFMVNENSGFSIECSTDGNPGPLRLGETKTIIDFVQNYTVYDNDADQQHILAGEPDLPANAYGFYLYQAGTDTYEVILKNNTIQPPHPLGIMLTTQGTFYNVLINGEAVSSSDIISEDGKSICYDPLLDTGEMHRLRFQISDGHDFTVACGGNGELGPLYLGVHEYPVSLNRRLFIPGENEVTQIIWNGKENFINRWVENGTYTITVEAFGKYGGYDSDSIDIEISTPMNLKLKDIDNYVIKPLVEENCTVTMSCDKACSVQVEVFKEGSSDVVKVLEAVPPVLERAGIFSFTWNGTDASNSIVPDDPDVHYLFHVTAASLTGSTTVEMIIGDSADEWITVDSGIVLDPGLEADIIAPGTDSPVKGDTSYTININPEGRCYPDADATITVQPESGTQMVKAYPDMNYMVGLRKIPKSLGVKASVAGVGAYSLNSTCTWPLWLHMDGYWEIDAEAIIYNINNDTIIRKGDNGNIKVYSEADNNATVYFDLNAATRNYQVKLPLNEYVVFYDDPMSTYGGEIINGTTYMDPTVNATGVQVYPTEYLGETTVLGDNNEILYRHTYRAEVNVVIEVNVKSDFDAGDYCRIVDYFYVMGPNITEENDYVKHTEFVSYGINVFDYKLEGGQVYLGMDPIPGDVLASREVYIWQPAYPYLYLYYINEDYPEPPEPSPEGRTSFDDLPGEKYEIDKDNPRSIMSIPGVMKHEICASIILTNGDVSYHITSEEIGGSDYYQLYLTIKTDAYDYLECVYPYSREDFYEERDGVWGYYKAHYLKDAEGNTLPAKINGERDAGEEHVTPNYHVPSMLEGDETNLYFDPVSSVTEHISTTLTYQYDPDNPYNCRYTGEFDLRSLYVELPGEYENINAHTWKIINVDVDEPGIITSIPGLLDHIITLPDDVTLTIPGDTISIVTADIPWDLGYDTYYNPDQSVPDGSKRFTIGSGPENIFADNPEEIHKEGKTPVYRISSFYKDEVDIDNNPVPPGTPLDKNMFLHEADWIDNIDVVIAPDTGGNYEITLSGIDNKEYDGLQVNQGDIVYNGRGGKMHDNFFIQLNNDPVKRLVPVVADWDRSDESVVSLSYLDQYGSWVTILSEDEQPADPENNILVYWDVAGLNGLVTLKLTVQQELSNGDIVMNIATKEVIVGQEVSTSSGGASILSGKGEAVLHLPEGSLSADTVISIDAVDLEDIEDIVYFADDDIPTAGKIVSLQPDGLEFEPGKQAVLQFIYHRTELADVNLPELVIYKLKPDGGLEALKTIHRYFRNGVEDYIYEYDADYPEDFHLPGSWDYVKVWTMELTGFSYYSTLEDVLIGGPHMNHAAGQTNQLKITISGKGEPGQLMEVYVLDTPLFDPDKASPAPIPLIYSDTEGYFEIPGISLPYEGKNYLFAGYNTGLEDKWSKCVVTRDTVAPVLTVVPYNPVISPDGDGIRDTLPLYITSNEDGLFDVILKDSDQNTIGVLGTRNVTAGRRTMFLVDGTDGSGHDLLDGIYQLHIIPEDKTGNRGPGNIYILVIDNAGAYDDHDIIPPRTDIIIGNPQHTAPDSTLYITSHTPVRLQAVDNPGGSGIHQINYRINGGSWVSINGAEHLFTLSGPDGPYTIDYFSFDLWGNPEPVKSITLYLDNSAPETNITTGLPHYLNDDNQLFITSLTPVYLSAADMTGSGVTGMRYRINRGSWISISSTEHSFTIDGTDDLYSIEYFSIDNCGNSEPIKRTDLYLDNTPPDTHLTPGVPRYLSPDSRLFITSLTPLRLSADDNDGSGVDVINYRINGGSWVSRTESDYTFMITGEDGMYVIDYYSIDHCENSESVKSATFYLDNTPPETDITIGTPQYLAPDDKLFITSHTPVELHAVDNPGGSGVEFINYRINDGTWMKIHDEDCSFEIIGEDGMYTVSYYSSDNCDNTEEMNSIVLYLDNTPPVVDICVELKGTPRRVYLPDDTEEIELTDNEKLVAEVEDAKEKLVGTTIVPIPYSGLASAKFRIGNGVWQDLTADNLDAALIGMDEVLTEIEAIDNVDNAILTSYIISHYAIFSVPGAVISTTGNIMLNSGITIDSYDSETGMQHTGDGDVISKGKITINSTPTINGDLYDYTDPGIEKVPVPADARVIDSFIVNSGETKVIQHGSYYIKNLIVNANGRLIIQGGWVKIWFDWCTVDGKIEVDTVKHLWMLGTNTTQHMNINGSSIFKGILFIPEGYVNVNGRVNGSVIGKEVTVNSGAYIYYDQDSLIHDRWSTIGDAAQD